MSIVRPEPDEAFARLMAIGGGMFREGIPYAATAISLELVAQAESHRLEGTLHHKSQYRDLLKQAIREMLSLSYDRIRQGETNIKQPMFLSMVLAQVDAIEEGIPCDTKTAQSARDSLESCHEMLRTRAGTSSLSYSDDAGISLKGVDGGQSSLGVDLDWDFFLPDTDFIL